MKLNKQKREGVFTFFVWAEYRLKEKKNSNFIVNKIGRRRVRIKGRWKDGVIIALRYGVVGKKNAN